MELNEFLGTLANVVVQHDVSIKSIWYNIIILDICIILYFGKKVLDFLYRKRG